MRRERTRSVRTSSTSSWCGPASPAGRSRAGSGRPWTAWPARWPTVRCGPSAAASVPLHPQGRPRAAHPDVGPASGDHAGRLATSVRNVVACPRLPDSRRRSCSTWPSALPPASARGPAPTTRCGSTVTVPSARSRPIRRRVDVEPLYGTRLRGSSRSGWPGRGQLHRHLQPRPRPGARGRARRRRRLRRPRGWRPGASHARPDDTFPRLADPLAWVPADAVEDVAEAVVLAFRDLGNREDRKRAG